MPKRASGPTVPEDRRKNVQVKLRLSVETVMALDRLALREAAGRKPDRSRTVARLIEEEDEKPAQQS